MFDSTIFNRIFGNVLHDDIIRDNIDESDIREGVKIMAALYSPQPQSLQTESRTVPNYNFISHRCAYLHKYAAFHTALVYDMMQVIIQDHWNIFKNSTESGNFNLCCLGGGPGSDAIGVLAALNSNFNDFKMAVTIVDIMKMWEMTFASVVNELKYGHYGHLQNVAQNFLEWDYIAANLLGSMSNPVNKAIARANLVTMVKFVSATACQDTEDMLRKIFNVLKPGAMVLFIDNDGGGFNQLVRKAARQGELGVRFKRQTYHYSNENMKMFRFGYQSCCDTTVTVYLLQKQYGNQFQEQCCNIPRNANQNSDAVGIHQPLSVRTLPNLDEVFPDFKPQASCTNSMSSQDYHRNENEIHESLSGLNTAPNIGERSSISPHNGMISAQNRNEHNINYARNTLPKNQNLNRNRQKKRYNLGRRSQSSNRNNRYMYAPISPSRSSSAESDIFSDSPEDTDCSCCVIS